MQITQRLRWLAAASLLAGCGARTGFELRSESSTHDTAVPDATADTTPDAAADAPTPDFGIGEATPDAAITESVVASHHQTFLLTAAGGVKSWGDNPNGELGNGTVGDPRLVPADVIGLTSGVQAIAASPGGTHACALTVSGAVKCWGGNHLGQLGLGSFGSPHTVPEDVRGLGGGVTAIAVGYNHTCALTAVGGVKCWGDNARGMLGLEPIGDARPTPTDVPGLESGVTAIATGHSHTCALMAAGRVKCWGSYDEGQLGDGKLSIGDSRATPGDVIGLENVTAIAAGEVHTCALTADRAVWCWGYGFDGELGIGDFKDSATPVRVDGLPTDVVSITAGHRFTCALSATGTAKCWGENYHGQLGLIATAEAKALVPIDLGVKNATEISGGWAHACAVTKTSGVMCWGENFYGQLGDGTSGADRATPAEVKGL